MMRDSERLVRRDRLCGMRDAESGGVVSVHSSQVRVQASRCEAARSHCPIQFTVDLIHGKWKARILTQLQNGPVRLGQLRRILPEASKKVLTQHLREMELDGLIVRTDLSDKLRHVEYSLSENRGVAILPIIQTLATWGTEHRPQSNKGGVDRT